MIQSVTKPQEISDEVMAEIDKACKAAKGSARAKFAALQQRMEAALPPFIHELLRIQERPAGFTESSNTVMLYLQLARRFPIIVRFDYTRRGGWELHGYRVSIMTGSVEMKTIADALLAAKEFYEASAKAVADSCETEFSDATAELRIQ